MEKETSVIMCNPDTIKCTNCKWAKISRSFTDSSCMQYKQKPYNVYFKSEDCPRFEEDIESNE